MSYHEKVWRANVYIILLASLIILVFSILNFPDRVILASFGFMGFIAVPGAIYRNQLKKEQDEMIKEISRRAMAVSFKLVWFIIFAAIFILYFTHLNDETITIPTLSLQLALWGSFAMIILAQSLAGLYYLKKGVSIED